MRRKIQAIDLFCGVGGLTFGLEKSGIQVLAGLDNDSSCADAFHKNCEAKFILADVAQYDFRNMASLFSRGAARVLVGCAPCQPFSSHLFKAKDRENDQRWNLITYFLNAIDALNPDVISMENVRGLTAANVFHEFVEEVCARGYSLDYDVVYCPDYGIPQNRHRLVVLGSRLGNIALPKKHMRNAVTELLATR